jgi:hypothetical protein
MTVEKQLAATQAALGLAIRDHRAPNPTYNKIIKNLSVNNISTVYGMAATQSDEGCCDVVEGEAVSG